MKIKINEFESYNIEFPEKMDVQTFMGLVDRLNALKKMIDRDNIVPVPVTWKLGETKANEGYHTKYGFLKNINIFHKAMRIKKNQGLEALRQFAVSHGVPSSVSAKKVMTNIYYYKSHVHKLGKSK